MDHSETVVLKPSAVRHSNYRLIINTVSSLGVCSAADIADAVGLSKTAVSKAILRLLDWGYIVSCGKGSTTEVGGKRPELYAINASYRYTCSISFYHGTTIVEICNFAGEQIIRQTYNDRIDLSSQENFIQFCRSCLCETLTLGKITIDQLIGVMIISDYDRFSGANKIIEALFPDDASKESFKQRFAASLNLSAPVYIENSRYLRGFAELRTDNTRKSKTIAVISILSSNITGSVISQGNILTGTNDLMGEFGHVITGFELNRKCRCGQRGCIVSVVLKNEIIGIAKERLKTGEASSLLPLYKAGTLDLFDILDAGHNGDALASSIMQYSNMNYARLLYTIHITLNPDEIIIQTGDYQRDSFFKMIRDCLGQLLPPDNQPKLSASSLIPLDASFIGAADFCISKHLSNPACFDLSANQ